VRTSLGMTENINIEYKEFPNPEEIKKKVEQEHGAENKHNGGGGVDKNKDSKAKKDNFVIQEERDKEINENKDEGDNK